MCPPPLLVGLVCSEQYSPDHRDLFCEKFGSLIHEMSTIEMASCHCHSGDSIKMPQMWRHFQTKIVNDEESSHRVAPHKSASYRFSLWWFLEYFICAENEIHRVIWASSVKVSTHGSHDISWRRLLMTGWSNGYSMYQEIFFVTVLPTFHQCSCIVQFESRFFWCRVILRWKLGMMIRIGHERLISLNSPLTLSEGPKKCNRMDFPMRSVSTGQEGQYG